MAKGTRKLISATNSARQSRLVGQEQYIVTEHSAMLFPFATLFRFAHRLEVLEKAMATIRYRQSDFS